MAIFIPLPARQTVIPRCLQASRIVQSHCKIFMHQRTTPDGSAPVQWLRAANDLALPSDIVADIVVASSLQVSQIDRKRPIVREDPHSCWSSQPGSGIDQRSGRLLWAK